MSDSRFFQHASRRVLFGPDKSDIPGQGRSASEASTRHLRQKITLNLDCDLLEHFKALAEEQGRPYQLLINDALRAYVKGTSVEQLSQEVGELLLNNESFLTAVRLSLSDND